jgi:hypothetical protein
MKYENYKNIFCAICNKATNLKYWKIEAELGFIGSGNVTIQDIFSQKKAWKLVNRENYTRYCKPQYPGCKNESSLAHLLRMNSTRLQSICNSYSFPIKVCSRPASERISRNLHCMFCEGKQYNEATFKEDCGGNQGLLPPQTITFNFAAHEGSSSSHNDNFETRLIQYRCDAQTVYDPFSDKCRSLSDKNDKEIPGHEKEKQKSYNNSKCLQISANNSQIASVLSNGSITIKGRIHNVSLVAIDNSSFICWNDTSSTSYPGASKSRQRTTAPQVITAIGFALSSAFLIFLLFTYIIYPDLRTTPGKCVMSLSCAVLLYMACHVPLTSTSYPVLCIGNAIVLHYSLLAVFSWMGVLAFDICKRFGSQGKCYKLGRYFIYGLSFCTLL